MQTQHLFARAAREVASANSPTDSFALDVSPRHVYTLLVAKLVKTLTVFFASVLKKKYTNPSSDAITVLAGLDEVDRVTSDFVAVLDGVIRNGRSCKHGAFSATLMLSNWTSRYSAQGYQNSHCNDQRGLQDKPGLVFYPS